MQQKLLQLVESRTFPLPSRGGMLMEKDTSAKSVCCFTLLRLVVAVERF